MTATRSRPDPKVEAATEKQELAGSEINSQNEYTPEGMKVASSEAGSHDTSKALLTPAAFAKWVAQTYCEQVKETTPRPDDETLVRELLDLTNARVLWANDLRRPPYPRLKPLLTITRPQKKVLEKSLSITIAEQLVMDVTSVVEDDELPEQLSVSERDEAAYLDEVGAEFEGKLDAAGVARWVLQHFDLGMSFDGMAYLIPKGKRDPRVARSVKSMKGTVLARLFDSGTVSANKDTVGQAMDALEAKAEQCEPDELAVRCWQTEESVTIDLGMRDGTLVRITKGGYEQLMPWHEDVSGIRWRRARGSEPLPMPEDGGTRDDVAKVLCLDPTSVEFRLTYGWLVASHFARVKRPILWNVGVMGSGKSTRAKMLMRLVDPRPELGNAPSGSSRDDLVVAAARYVPSYDNIGKVTPLVSDMFCRMVTGFEFSRRGLYTDDDVVTSTMVRTAIATSVELPYGLGPDALERICFIEYERMKDSERRTEAELEADFNARRAQLLGAIYLDVAGVLEHLEAARTAGHVLPRMADYAIVLHALDASLGLEGDDGFAAAYFEHVDQTMADRANSDPLTEALMKLLPKSGDTWKGTAENLSLALNVFRPTDSKVPWPAGGAQLSGALRRKAELLRRTGVLLDYRRERRPGTKKVERIIHIRNVSGFVDESYVTDAEQAELLALARTHADGYRGHLVELGDQVVGVEIHENGQGGFMLLQGGALDPTPWDPTTRTYNGAPARPWLEVDSRFRVA